MAIPETTDHPAHARADTLITQFRQRRDTRLDPSRKRLLSLMFGRPGAPSNAFFPRAARRFWEIGDRQMARFLSNVQIDEIRVRLMRAGFPLNLKATHFAFVKWVLMVTFSMLLGTIFPVLSLVSQGTPFEFDITGTTSLVAMLIGALYGFKAPDVWLSIRTRQRQLAIQLALPDMIDLITVSVEAGLGLNAAIQRVSSRFHNELSDEFVRTMQEVHLGRSQPDSLRDMARRVDVADLTTFLISLVQAEQLGLAIANVLRVQSERLREKRSQRAREQAQKAPIKMIFPLVFFVFPALFIVILGPAAIQFMKNPL